MSRRVAVTGGTGFIGRHIAKKLQQAGYEVRILSRRAPTDTGLRDTEISTVDWRDPATVRRGIAGANIVIHAAAVHPLRTAGNAANIVKENVGITKTLLESIQTVDRFVLISSMRSLVNANSQNGHFDERTHYDFQRSDSPYGYSKYLAEELCLRYWRQRGLPVVVCNPCSVIGPDDTGLSPNGQDILNFTKRHWNFVMDTNFAFVDVRDVADGVELILRKEKVGEKYLLCAANWSMEKYVRTILEAAGRQSQIHVVAMPLATVIALSGEMVKRLSPSAAVPAVMSSIRFAKLRPIFNGSKIARLGLMYRDPHQTIQDTADWMKRHRLLQMAARESHP